MLPQRQTDVLAVRHLDVAEVAGGALRRRDGALPSLMMPLPMPVATLTNIRCWRRSGNDGVALAEGHHVHVVVDDHERAAKADAEVALHVEAVPAGHDRRVDGAAGRVLDRARAARCRCPARSAATRPSSAIRRLAVLDRPSRGRPRGRAPTSRSSARSASTRAARSVTAEPHVGGADVGRQHDPRRRG